MVPETTLVTISTSTCQNEMCCGKGNGPLDFVATMLHERFPGGAALPLVLGSKLTVREEGGESLWTKTKQPAK